MSRATSVASSHIVQVASKRTEDMQKQQELLLVEARRELDQEKQSRLRFEREADARLTKAQRECVGVGVGRCSLVDWVCVLAGRSFHEQKVLFLFSQMPQDAAEVAGDDSDCCCCR